MTNAGVTDLRNIFYDSSNRYVSAVFLDDLNNAQALCFKGDLGGS